MWLDIENKYCWPLQEKVWKAAEKGGTEVKLISRKSSFSSICFSVINFDPKKIIFREGMMKLQLTLHRDLKFRTVKKILALQKENEDIWFKFKLNNDIFNEESRIYDLPLSCGLIELECFKVQNKLLVFKYLNGCFKDEFKNTTEFESVESEVKNQLGFGIDVEFQDRGDRKIQKGELVHELDVINLVKNNKIMSKKECAMIDLKLEIYRKMQI
jgi:hypothetical protein